MSVIGNSIQSDILHEVKRARFFLIIADEVTDVANREELSIAVRYVLNGEIKEVFVDFVEVDRITGEVLAQNILQWLRIHSLSPTDMRGQCYDGASNLSLIHI